MTFGQAMTALEEGKKIRRKGWAGSSFIHREGDTIIDNYNQPHSVRCVGLPGFWELFVEPDTLQTIVNDLAEYTCRPGCRGPQIDGLISRAKKLQTL